LISILVYFEKKILSLYSESLTFLALKKSFSQETAQNKEKSILEFDLRILSAFQIHMKYRKVPKSLDPIMQRSAKLVQKSAKFAAGKINL
jgi:hypothetical protein